MVDCTGILFYAVGYQSSVNNGNLRRTDDSVPDFIPLTKPLLCITSTIVDKAVRTQVSSYVEKVQSCCSTQCNDFT